MHDHRSIGEQILRGIFIALWLLSRPFVWIYFLLHWLVLGIVRETGNRVIKIVGGLVAAAIIAYAAQLFLY